MATQKIEIDLDLISNEELIKEISDRVRFKFAITTSRDKETKYHISQLIEIKQFLK